MIGTCISLQTKANAYRAIPEVGWYLDAPTLLVRVGDHGASVEIWDRENIPPHAAQDSPKNTRPVWFRGNFCGGPMRIRTVNVVIQISLSVASSGLVPVFLK